MTDNVFKVSFEGKNPKILAGLTSKPTLPFSSDEFIIEFSNNLQYIIYLVQTQIMTIFLSVYILQPARRLFSNVLFAKNNSKLENRRDSPCVTISNVITKPTANQNPWKSKVLISLDRKQQKANRLLLTKYGLIFFAFLCIFGAFF